jgi:NIMA (never in mitosis gene a)-related kinase
MEFAGRGDLLKLIHSHTKKNTKLPEEEIWKALLHLSRALRTLHDQQVVHRDLKCANVFITEDGTYKLGDLNVSKVIK